MGDFIACYTVTMKEEGWHLYSNQKDDPGGATYCGVTQVVWDGYCQNHGLPKSGVRTMTDGQCMLLYRAQYWDAIHGDDLPPGVDLVVWDEAVNAGPVTAIKLLQQVLDLRVDGHFGQATLAAVKAANDRGDLICRYDELRLSVLHRLRTWTYFKKGWSARVQDITHTALRMMIGGKYGR